MGIGAGKLYVTRLENESKKLYLTYFKPILKEDGEYYRPENTPLGLEFEISDYFPELKKGDEPIEVKLELCEEDTRLYVAAENGYFSNEIWMYVGEKPELNVINENTKCWEYNPNSQMPSHINPAVFINNVDIKAYEDPKNVKLIKI